VTESSAKTYSASNSRGPIRLPADAPTLGAQSVHLWLCASDQIASSDEFKRRVLSQYAPVDPADWQFALNEHGKPGLLGGEHGLDFNLSHSGDWLACAVTAGIPIGVDIEFCDPKRVSMKVARRFFRAEEVADLESCDDTRRGNHFFDIWTLKEAGVKARGEALAPGLKSRGFALDFVADSQSERGQIAVNSADAADSAQYCLLDPLTDYRVALCWNPGTSVLPQPSIFELREGSIVERLVSLRASTWLN
jgi:phosphopantetheine--protein transferase-like protein